MANGSKRQSKFSAPAPISTPTTPLQLLGAGKFYLLTGDPVTAIGALQNSLKLDPEIPAKYFLAYAKAQQGQHRRSQTAPRNGIPSTDSQYTNAQTLLKILAAR